MNVKVDKMKDRNSDIFIKALKDNNINLIKMIPKGEFHNHSALGINRRLLKSVGIKIPKICRIDNIEEMNKFSKKYISKLTQQEDGFKMLIEGTVFSAIDDGVAVLETSIDYRFFKFYDDDINRGLLFLKELKNKYKNKISLRYDIGLSRKNYDIRFEESIQKLIDSNLFSGMDIYGEEKYNDLSKFKSIYEYGRQKKLKLKAHVGEFGTAEDIIKTIEYLNLNVVQHGISIINSYDAVRYVKDKNIIFNICPTSNILLKRIENIKEHPIKKMYDVGLKMSINTDDLLLFDSTLSNEYLTLFNNNVLSAEELDKIRVESLIY